ncbi:tetratricopeptide repeat protein [Kitasatospora sp. MAP5-34]|uniref:tetratricopeptide repeat protein n=1 Tax=Kitasatospora sp. MAP5-34 TaxID=3035102 RepID=UPI00247322D4|nr:tetratricopeptide repeat protein [Kitasatospora sp. MAP5-34]MDH6574558.1 tetratricopeptide (TPR) repeat protein [Kitasatospora sp. MAP5-34]
MRRLPLLLTTAALCGCLVAVGALRDDVPRTTPPPNGTAWRDARTPGPDGTVAQAIATDQARLRERPDDANSWAGLGALYVEQARLTSDPSYYPKADEALHRSLTLSPQANVDALTGLGTLANARHLFAEARDLAGQVITASPYHWQAYAVLADARTQLGDDQGATEAVQALLDRHPGTAAFTRAAYDLEQHGRSAEARQALQQALDGAFDPSDQAFCRYQMAELERNAGKPDVALAGYQQALRADPSYTPAVAGKARAEAALGHTDDALRDYTTAIGRIPLPQFLLELGELQESLGHTAEASRQYGLLTAEQQLAAANGVVDDLSLGQYEADHGDPAAAVRLLRGEWQRRQNALVADALAWALHRQGADGEAVGLAEQAESHGWHNALFSYHRGEIERALGRTDEARAHLGEALRTDPYFSPLQAPHARAALDQLDQHDQHDQQGQQGQHDAG